MELDTTTVSPIQPPTEEQEIKGVELDTDCKNFFIVPMSVELKLLGLRSEAGLTSAEGERVAAAGGAGFGEEIKRDLPILSFSMKDLNHWVLV